MTQQILRGLLLDDYHSLRPAPLSEDGRDGVVESSQLNVVPLVLLEYARGLPAPRLRLLHAVACAALLDVVLLYDNGAGVPTLFCSAPNWDEEIGISKRLDRNQSLACYVLQQMEQP